MAWARIAQDDRYFLFSQQTQKKNECWYRRNALDKKTNSDLSLGGREDGGGKRQQEPIRLGYIGAGVVARQRALSS